VRPRNWHARSLRLNFGYTVMALDFAFTKRMDQIIDRKIATARRLTLRKLAARGRFRKPRDALARLFPLFL